MRTAGDPHGRQPGYVRRRPRLAAIGGPMGQHGRRVRGAIPTHYSFARSSGSFGRRRPPHRRSYRHSSKLCARTLLALRSTGHGNARCRSRAARDDGEARHDRTACGIRFSTLDTLIDSDRHDLADRVCSHDCVAAFELARNASPVLAAHLLRTLGSDRSAILRSAIGIRVRRSSVRETFSGCSRWRSWPQRQDVSGRPGHGCGRARSLRVTRSSLFRWRSAWPGSRPS